MVGWGSDGVKFGKSVCLNRVCEMLVGAAGHYDVPVYIM